jgi:hypothetical protein
VKRTARMFDDRVTPRSPFVVTYSPRSHPDTLTDFSLSSTLRLQFAISICLSNCFSTLSGHPEVILSPFTACESSIMLIIIPANK